MRTNSEYRSDVTAPSRALAFLTMDLSLALTGYRKMPGQNGASNSKTRRRVFRPGLWSAQALPPPHYVYCVANLSELVAFTTTFFPSWS